MITKVLIIGTIRSRDIYLYLPSVGVVRNLQQLKHFYFIQLAG